MDWWQVDLSFESVRLPEVGPSPDAMDSVARPAPPAKSKENTPAASRGGDPVTVMSRHGRLDAGVDQRTRCPLSSVR
jgi:hypothetical protein